MHRCLIVVVVACWLTGAIGLAQGDRQVHMGAGLTSCGEWLDARNRHDESATLTKAMAGSWVQGFLFGAITHKVGDEYRAALDRLPDALSMEAWVDKYCRDNPLKTIIDAAERLQREVNERR